jgi:heme A synthase
MVEVLSSVPVHWKVTVFWLTVPLGLLVMMVSGAVVSGSGAGEGDGDGGGETEGCIGVTGCEVQLTATRIDRNRQAIKDVMNLEDISIVILCINLY